MATHKPSFDLKFECKFRILIKKFTLFSRIQVYLLTVQLFFLSHAQIYYVQKQAHSPHIPEQLIN